MPHNTTTMKEKIKAFFESPIFSSALSKVIFIIGACVAVVIIFFAGETVGFEKAEFSYHFGENYNRMFGGRDDVVMQPPFVGDNFFLSTSGGAGKIVKIALPKIAIEDASGVEKIIVVDSDTIVKQMRYTVDADTLKIGDTIVVLGSPDQNGEIDAKLIRLMPENFISTTTASSTQN